MKNLEPVDPIDLLLIVAVILLMAFVLGVLAFHPIPDKNMNLFTALAAGGVGAAFGAIIGYRFGSSRGAAKAREQVGQAVDALASAVPSADAGRGGQS